MTGASQSFTVTVKLHEAELLDVSVAVQVTVVVPSGNAVPDGGLQLLAAPGQLSLNEIGRATSRQNVPSSVEVGWLAGQVIVGFSQSFTVTVKVQVAELPDVS